MNHHIYFLLLHDLHVTIGLKNQRSEDHARKQANAQKRKTRAIAISRLLLAISDRRTDGPTDRRTDQQSCLQSRVHATKNMGLRCSDLNNCWCTDFDGSVRALLLPTSKPRPTKRVTSYTQCKLYYEQPELVSYHERCISDTNGIVFAPKGWPQNEGDIIFFLLRRLLGICRFLGLISL